MNNKLDSKNMFSNICENVSCGYNDDTGYCFKNIDPKKQQSHKCFCNISTGQCKKVKPNPELGKQISINSSKQVGDVALSSFKLKECNLKGFGKIHLRDIKSCYPLPPTSGLKYGVLKKNRDCVVYNNSYFYEIELIGEELCVYLENYKILIKSLKNCKLKTIE